MAFGGEDAMASADPEVSSPPLTQVSDDKALIEELFHIFESNITEEEARDINAVAEFSVKFNDGNMQKFFINFQNG